MIGDNIDEDVQCVYAWMIGGGKERRLMDVVCEGM
jgi:hypothetical protein